MPTFRYFSGPLDDVAGLVGEPVNWALCGAFGSALQLGGAVLVAPFDGEPDSAFGCFACLEAGRFGFEHITDIGTVGAEGLQRVYPYQEPPPADMVPDAVVTLFRTPDVLRWQYEPWLTHCGDFMVYIGLWSPVDFRRNANDGDGRSLFLRMTRNVDLQHLWEDVAEMEGGHVPDSWGVVYYVYRCRHCGEVAGNWDCD